jgi:hypothetical protein
MSYYTDDLETLRKEPHRFSMGKIKEFIDVGEYTIVKYTAGETVAFTSYVNGKSTPTAMSSLDGALLVAMAYRTQSRHCAHMLAIAMGRIVNIQVDL